MPKILLAGFAPSCASELESLLSKNGYEVQALSRLQDLRLLLLQEDAHLLLSEYAQDGLQGLEWMREAKRIRPQIPVLMLSENASLEAALLCIRSGAADYVLKPYGSETLLESIRKTIENLSLSNEHTMLQVLNSMKDKFLSLVSHELRTPLTLVYGYLSLLMQQKSAFEPGHQELLDIIFDATKKLIHIVNDIQLITQAETGKMPLHLQPLLPQKIGSDVMSEMQATLSNRKLSLRLEIASDLGPFNADSIRLRQALMELIQNAIRNTPDGGEVILGLRRDQGHEFLCFEVADTGQGISQQEQGLIFNRLHVIGDINNHTSGATTYKGSGLGIGLSLVKAVVEAHGGKIELSSQAGVGTTVRLYIPANLAPSTVTGPALPPGNE